MHDYFLIFLCSLLIRISVHSQPHCKYPAGHSDQLVDSCKYSLRCFHSSSSTLLTSINWALRSGTYTSVRTVNNKKRWNKSSWAQTKLIVFVTNILVIGISDTHSFSKFKQNYVSENPCTRNISAARKLKKIFALTGTVCRTNPQMLSLIKSPNLKLCVQAYLFLKNFKFLFALFYPHLDPRRRPSLWRRISENRSAGNEHTFLLCSISPSPWCAAKTFLFLYFIRSSHAKDLHWLPLTFTLSLSVKVRLLIGMRSQSS